MVAPGIEPGTSELAAVGGMGNDSLD
jgi:hypothetical protein